MNFEKRGDEFKKLSKFMLENSFKFKLLNYWRNIDKKILLSFLFFFFLVYFFHFPQLHH
jgi:hypothetical protein